jgi:hypothetical protein
MRRVAGPALTFVCFAAFLGAIGGVVGLASAALGVSPRHSIVIGVVAAASPWLLAMLGLGLLATYGSAREWRRRAVWRRQALFPGGGWVAEGSVRSLVSKHGAVEAPALGELRYVVGIGETRRFERSLLELRSLEVYAGGFRLSGRLRSALPPAPSELRRHFAFPALALAVEDDLGREYQVLPRGGGEGAGRGDSCEWEFRSLGAPALDPAARELRIVVDGLTWVRFGEGSQGWSYRAALPAVGWRFVVSLRPGDGDGGGSGFGGVREPRRPIPGGGSGDAAAEPPDEAASSACGV